MAKKKTLKGLTKGDKVVVVNSGKKGVVEGEYYAGGNVKDPVYTIRFSNGEARHYTLEQLEKVESGDEAELDYIPEGE